jgi:membrane protein
MNDATWLIELGKRVAADFSDKNVSFMAAGLAYNALVSLAPLLILLLLIASIVGGGLEARLIAASGNAFPGPIADVVTRIFSKETASSGVSIIGLVVLLWGTLKIFRGLDTAFSEIYETERNNTFMDQIADGIVVLVALLVSIVATIGGSTAFVALEDEIPLVGVVTPILLIGGLIVAFSPMYYRFPDTELGWRDVLPGTVFAAFGWATLQALFQVYLVFRGGGAESFFGGVLVVITWLYFSGVVLLLGAVLNAVIGGHSSGGTGGAGRGRTRDRSGVETRTVLQGAELATYLDDLRGRITSQYALARPAAGPNTGRRRTNEVEVIEWASSGEGEPERTITLRWRPADHEADA